MDRYTDIWIEIKKERDSLILWKSYQRKCGRTTTSVIVTDKSILSVLSVYPFC